MRATTAGELTTLGLVARKITPRVKVANGSGTMIDLTSWVETVKWDQDIDQPVSGATVEFRRDLGTTQSLAPLRTDSTLNVLDDNTTYSPLLDVGRSITIEIATNPIGTAPVAGDYKLEFKGTIDIVDWANSPVTVSCRDLGAPLVDRWIEAEATFGTAGGRDLELVMQDILDSVFGAGVVNLDTPVSPSYLVTTYTQQKQSVMDALQALAQLVGWDVRYKWNDTSSSFKLTLSEPPRTKTTPDYTFGPSAYFNVTGLALDITNIRNLITVSYSNGTSRFESSVNDSSSISAYGRRFFLIQEGDTSPINTGAEATALATAALADLKDPKAEFELELPFFWPGDLGDLYRFTTNSVHFNTNQDWATVSVRHELSAGRHSSFFKVRGSPAGGYLTWLGRDDLSKRATEAKPTALVELTGGTTKRGAYVFYSATNGVSPFTYKRKIDVEGVSYGSYSSYASLGAGVTEVIAGNLYHDTFVYLMVKDATGLESEPAMAVITAVSDSSDGAGTATGGTEEGRQRGGDGGVQTPNASIAARGLYLRDGSGWMVDPGGQMYSPLIMPAGTAIATTETYGNRAGAAIDSGGVVVTTGVDLVRSYTNKHLGNMPDDATSDRKAVTGNEKTGASRAYPALDSTSKLVTGVTTAATAADGLARIGSERFSAREAGHGGPGTVYEGFVRSGLGGIPTPGGSIYTNGLYSADGSISIIDTSSGSVVFNAMVQTTVGNPGLFIGGLTGVGAIDGQIKFQTHRTAPTLVTTGSMWWDGTNLFFRKAGSTVTII